jgi:hypothetical protein
MVSTPLNPHGQQVIAMKYLNNTYSSWYTVLYLYILTHCMCPCHWFFPFFLSFLPCRPLSLSRCFNPSTLYVLWLFHNSPLLLVLFCSRAFWYERIQLVSHSLWNTIGITSVSRHITITSTTMIFPKSPLRHFDPFSLNNIPLSSRAHNQQVTASTSNYHSRLMKTQIYTVHLKAWSLSLV